MGIGSIISHVKDNVLGGYDAVLDFVKAHPVVSSVGLITAVGAGLVIGGPFLAAAAAIWLGLAPGLGAIAGDLASLVLSFVKKESPSWEDADKAARIGGVMATAAITAMLATSGIATLLLPSAPVVLADVGGAVAAAVGARSEVSAQPDAGHHDGEECPPSSAPTRDCADCTGDGFGLPAPDFEDDGSTQGGEGPRSRGLIGALKRAN